MYFHGRFIKTENGYIEMPGKRANPVHNTPTKDPEKRTKENEPTVCPVCCLTTVENNDDVIGEDAIYCESDCKAWIHRKCIGMSKMIN